MKNIIQDLSAVGFLSANDFVGAPIEKQVPAEMILERLKERRHVPFDIIDAILNIENVITQKRAAVHLLRIVIYAKSISSKGKVAKWFDHGKVIDHATDSKFNVSAIKRSAEEFNKSKANHKKTTESIESKLNKKKNMSEREKTSLNKAELKADSYEASASLKLNQFLHNLDTVYVSLASERR